MRSIELKSPREASLERYFTPKPHPPELQGSTTRVLAGGGLMALGFLFFIVASGGFAKMLLGGVFSVCGLGLVARHAWHQVEETYRYRKALAAIYPQPSDGAVDQWLDDALDRIRLHSLERLALTAEDCTWIEDLCIVQPILWLKSGVEPSHVTWIRGRDQKTRFGVLEVSWLWPAEQHLAIFSCEYDLIQDAILNEKTYEYFYQDIVSVSVREVASSLTLKTGQSLTSQQELRIAVTNDQFLSIILGASQVKELTGTEWIPTSVVERTLSVIRKQMQEAKAQLRANA